MDMNNTANIGYSALLESMFSSSLSSNLARQPQPFTPALNERNDNQVDTFSGFDDMDFDNAYPSGGDEDTLHSIHHSDDSLHDVHDVHSPKEEGIEVEEKIVYEEFVNSVTKEIDNTFMQTGKRELSWNMYSLSKSRHEGAGEFYNLLLAASQRDLQVSQQQPFCDITVSLYQ